MGRKAVDREMEVKRQREREDEKERERQRVAYGEKEIKMPRKAESEMTAHVGKENTDEKQRWGEGEWK